MINVRRLTFYIEKARQQHIYAVLINNGQWIDGTRIALMALYELLIIELNKGVQND